MSKKSMNKISRDKMDKIKDIRGLPPQKSLVGELLRDESGQYWLDIKKDVIPLSYIIAQFLMSV